MKKGHLELAIEAAITAGQAIESYRGAPFSISIKDDHSPVTEADLLANELIVELLQKGTPQLSILSEESGFSGPFLETEQLAYKRQPLEDGGTQAPGEKVQDGPYGERLWCIDPLDGTKAFIQALKHDEDPNLEEPIRGYAVQIALLEKTSDGYETRLGVVYDPVYKQCFYAQKGGGAYLADAEGEPSRLTFSASGSLERAGRRRLLRSLSMPNEVLPQFESMGIHDLGAMRSVGIKVGQLVLDKADLYISPHALSWWDLAAPQIILEEAGGEVTDFKGKRPLYGELSSPLIPGPLLFSRGQEHQTLLRELNRGLAMRRRELPKT